MKAGYIIFVSLLWVSPSELEAMQLSIASSGVCADTSEARR
ncbi:hypothetical protein swp_3433 [Shewanella piezotolerans WP3]|uniref:Uncharacterized protein n=1 Tax=Shewanella piezotolerans (strain WP3 / JCM 13877) TaxID=225849 RepID=B8CRX4_SHEPW|nr:hypothetical protein swp_3433 [Shewanella piezotolerans WP3]